MQTVEIITSALVMGAVGSLHCIGMCGPLALALPLTHRSHRGRLVGGALYNLGRALTYSAMGLAAGLVGQTFLTPRLQSALSVGLGALIFLYLLTPARYRAATALGGWAGRPFGKLRAALGRLFHTPLYSSLLGIGLLNGLLPCGLVYLALSSSLLTGTATKGALFMLFFGLGTFPAMGAAVFFGSLFHQQLRRQLRRAVPVLLFVMATLLVLRGLDLGIPFISPHLPTAPDEAATCH